MGKSYSTFLKSKAGAEDLYGFEPTFWPEKTPLFAFQLALLEWTVRKGRAAIFADCGLGKSGISLTWAENIVRKTNKPVLILTPLAVGPQFVKEGEKFGIPCRQIRDGRVRKGINIINYERLHYLDNKDFVGIVCDESGILKAFAGKLRRRITDFLHGVEYRLLASATPAPNDYVELGNSSDALGGIGRNTMLRTYFLAAEDPVGNIESTHHYRLKGHARQAFWRWVASWARACRKPSDLGFPDDGFILPELKVRQHLVGGSGVPDRGFGLALARSLEEQRRERRRTLDSRCNKVAELLETLPKDDFAVTWCHLNKEGDLLEKLIPGAVQVAGIDRDEVKEERLAAFAVGQIRVLVTKAKIGGWGLNWQHCNYMTFFPSHSYEGFYQSIRRCWRFGQKRSVMADIVTSRAESIVLANMVRKEKQAAEMFAEIVRAMDCFQRPKMEEINGVVGDIVEVPRWLR